MAKEEHIYAFDRRDRVNVLDAIVSLNLQRDDDVLVGVSNVAKETSLVGGSLREVNRAAIDISVPYVRLQEVTDLHTEYRQWGTDKQTQPARPLPWC